jgi:hypothetical protein
MDDQRCQQFFREPCQTQQRHYEALRAFFLERRPLPEIARQFGFAHGTLRNLVSQFRSQCQDPHATPFLFHLPGDDRPGSAPALPRRVRRRRPSPTAAPSR